MDIIVIDAAAKKVYSTTTMHQVVKQAVIAFEQETGLDLFPYNIVTESSNTLTEIQGRIYII